MPVKIETSLNLTPIYDGDDEVELRFMSGIQTVQIRLNILL